MLALLFYNIISPDCLSYVTASLILSPLQYLIWNFDTIAWYHSLKETFFLFFKLKVSIKFIEIKKRISLVQYFDKNHPTENILQIVTRINKPARWSNDRYRVKHKLFHLISWWGRFPQTNISLSFSDDVPENLEKWSVYGKRPHQEIRWIRWNYD